MKLEPFIHALPQALFLTVCLALIVERSPAAGRIASRIVRWSVNRRHTANSVRAEIRAEELARLVDDRRMNLLKLTTALRFALSATGESAINAAATANNKGGGMSQRNMQYTAIAFIIFYLLSQPSNAADVVKDTTAHLGDAGNSVAEFVNQLGK